ncbi:hypothetical protein AAE478_000343 [Parahypoxylon ruwenzoriense]
MVNGLERLERLFGGSRKKEKGRGIKRRDTSSSSRPSQPHKNDPYFPSPSFMRPTSTHMRPREEPNPWTRVSKERSQSLPEPQGNRISRSSAGSSTITNEKYCLGDSIRSTLLSDNLPSDALDTPRLSQFKFLGDFLLESEMPEASLRGDSVKEPAHELTARESQTEDFLDWRPKRVSSLLDTLGLETPLGDFVAKSPDGFSESLTWRSRSVSPRSRSPITRTNSVVIAPRLSSKGSSNISTQELTFFPIHQLPSRFSRSHPDSPPASDGEEECPGGTFIRTILFKDLPSLNEITPRTSLECTSQLDTDYLTRVPSCRESWGTRPEDPMVACITPEEGIRAIQLQPIRKSASVASFSTVIKHSINCCDLREPTLDDFYSLHDDDLAESLPATSNPDSDIPPTPPPKDSPRVSRRHSSIRRKPGKPIAPTTAIDPSSGELTPPCTPTDSQFLTLTYSATHASGALGAMWAASIAKTYNFDLVYVISLWPGGEGERSDSSRHTSIRRKAQDTDRVVPGCAIVANPKYGVTGRLLAAYGLNEFGSPFRIHTEFHTKMLRFRGWKEYRDELASPGMISRGWTCSFYNDQAQAPRNNLAGGKSERGNTKNRGIIFAAYTRKTTKSAIPVRSSPKQTAILGRLRYDAQTLVDALIHGA